MTSDSPVALVADRYKDHRDGEQQFLFHTACCGARYTPTEASCRRCGRPVPARQQASAMSRLRRDVACLTEGGAA